MPPEVRWLFWSGCPDKHATKVGKCRRTGQPGQPRWKSQFSPAGHILGWLPARSAGFHAMKPTH